MRRATVIFIIFIILIAAVIGVSQFLQNQPPLTIQVAVDPLAADWITEAATRFNESSPLINATQRVSVEVTVVSEMDVWRGQANWSASSHPDAWIPSSSTSITYAQNTNIAVQTSVDSLAQTLLVWGGYASRTAVLTDGGTQSLDWDTVAQAAEAEAWSALGGNADWQFFKVAFALPDRAMSGLAVLFSGAASLADTPNLTGGQTRGSAFFDWMLPIIGSVPNFQTLGGDVAAAVARGPSTADIALLPEKQWLQNLTAMTNNEAVTLYYPAYQFVFDFPLARWDDVNTTDDQRAAVAAFGNWLLSATEQSHAIEKGLRPATGEVPSSAALFGNASSSGIQLTPVYETIIPPSRTDALALVSWFSQNQRR